MSRAIIPLVISLAWFLVGSAEVAASAVEETADEDTDFAAQDEPAAEDDEDRGFMVHYQVGFFARIAGSEPHHKNSDILATFDLAGVVGDPRRSRWGLGAHVALDGDGQRIGARFLWRAPLDRSGDSYVQFAPGIYIDSAGDSMSLTRPGYFCELEIGYRDGIAALISVEILPYDRYLLGYVEDPDASYWEDDIPVYEEAGTSVTVNAGLKFGQSPGVIATVVGAALAAIAIAQSFQ